MYIKILLRSGIYCYDNAWDLKIFELEFEMNN